MYYTIYITTNLINNKKYIGKHETESLDDDYLGSGLILNKAIKKYGRHNFKKQVIYVFDNNKDMMDKEVEMITEEVINSPEYYNIAYGGQGGCIVLKSGHPLYEITKKKISQTNSKNGKIISERQKELYVTGKLIHPMLGKSQTEQQKLRVSQALKNKPKNKEAVIKQTQSIMKTLHAPGYIHPNTGLIRSSETIQKIKDNHRNMKGQHNHMFGKQHNEESRLKMSNAQKNIKKQKCIHCNMMASPSNIVRWHNDNCKFK